MTESTTTTSKSIGSIEGGPVKDRRWYLVACKPKQDARAAQNLKNQNVNTIFQQVDVKKMKRGKKQICREPLFPGYLFVEISPEDPQWSKIRSTFGVRDWVRFGGVPARVPGQVIESLLGQPAPELMDKTFKKGSRVRIAEGPFVGLEGIYDIEDGESRSMVLIELLGKSNRLSVENQHLQPSE